MKKRYLNPKELDAPRFYSHAVSVAGGCKLVHVSGQVSYDREGVVYGKGAGWDDVVKMNGYMVGMNAGAVDVYRGVRARHLKRDRLPASTLVGVERLVHPDLLLEVELMAAVEDKPVPKQKR